MRQARRTPPPSTYLRVADVARQLNVTRQHVYNLIERGQLKAVSFGGAKRIPKQYVDDFLAAAHAEAGIPAA